MQLLPSINKDLIALATRAVEALETIATSQQTLARIEAAREGEYR